MQAKQYIPLVLLFILAFAVRVVGVDYGYFLGDERINDAARALGGDLVPRQHFYPPLFNYLNAVAFGGLFVFGKVFGVWADGGAFRAQYFTDPTVFFVTARVVTAACGAALAPLGFLIARDLKFDRKAAIWVALLVSLSPIAIYFSYIAKSDIPLASAVMWVVLIFLAQSQTPGSNRLAVFLGAAIALTLSFKQSVVFFLTPLFVAQIVLLVPVLGLGRYLKQLTVSILTLGLLWPILNIGIVLDFQNFLEFQKVQAVISVQGNTEWWSGLPVLILRALDPQAGLGWILAPLFLFVPVWLARTPSDLPNRRTLKALWWATLSGMVLFALTTRDRQPEHFWIYFFVVAALLASLMVIDLMKRHRFIGLGFAGAALVLSGVSIVQLWQQTLAQPVRVEVSQILKRDFPERNVMSMIALDIHQTQAAQAFEFQRADRLAAKYEISLPPRAAERYLTADASGSQFIIDFPTTLFGLEDASEEDLKGKVKPYAWPLQPEEWQLSYWVAQDIDVLVVSDLVHQRARARSALLRNFYSEVAETCQLHATLDPVKPLFLEREISIFDCSSD